MWIIRNVAIVKCIMINNKQYCGATGYRRSQSTRDTSYESDPDFSLLTRPVKCRDPFFHLQMPDSRCINGLSKRQSRLSSLWIAHLVHLHIISHLNIIHSLRRNENELPAHGAPGRLNHHAHTRGAVDAVHENVELIEAADWRAHSLPDTEQETDRRERLLAARQGLSSPASIGRL